MNYSEAQRINDKYDALLKEKTEQVREEQGLVFNPLNYDPSPLKLVRKELGKEKCDRYMEAYAIIDDNSGETFRPAYLD